MAETDIAAGTFEALLLRGDGMGTVSGTWRLKTISGGVGRLGPHFVDDQTGDVVPMDAVALALRKKQSR